MKHILKILLLILFCFILLSCKKNKMPHTSVIIPQPSQLTIGKGMFHLSGETSLSIETSGQHKQQIAQWLTNIPATIPEEGDNKNWKNSIQIILNNDTTLYTGKDTYLLQIDSENIKIEAGNITGIYYAIQSLTQLYIAANDGKIECQTVEDEPQFNYRGLLLDVSHHYFDIQFIKKQLDAMAYFKMNKLMLYIAGEGGWRLEIEKYPWLTQPTVWRTYEEVYTSNDIKELVAYANSHCIEIIPAIELPCFTDKLSNAYQEHIDCHDTNSQSAILKDIITATIKAFSAKTIYIGNGKTDGTRATACVSCLPRVGDGDESDVSDPRNIAIRTIEQDLKRQGVKLLTWESAIRGGIDAKESTVIAWHETDEGIKASEMNYDVVMAPSTYMSLDYYQSNPTVQPESMSGFLPLEMVYNYNPDNNSHPDKNTTSSLFGIQANMWTKYTTTQQDVETMLYPRLLAVAEVAWSKPERKSFLEFKRRAVIANNHLKSKGYAVFDIKTEDIIRPESEQPLESMAKNKPIVYNSLFDERYPASGKLTLTDGECGGWSYNDGRWQGFLNTDVDVTVDLGTKMPVKYISATFIYDRSGNIFLPYHVEILGSTDGASYKLLGDIANTFEEDKSAFALVPFTWNGSVETRYVRYIAKYKGRADGWLFTDEIVIN